MPQFADGAKVAVERIDGKNRRGESVKQVAVTFPNVRGLDGGVYVLTYTANHFMDQDYALGMATAKSIDGPWKKYPGNPVMLRYGKYVGTGCNTFFRDAGGRWKSVFHSHHSLGQVSPRRMHIVEVEWKMKDDTPVPVFGREVD